MSLDLGPQSAGKRRFRTFTISVVSSIESVVWVVRATLLGSGISMVSASSTLSTRITESGASPRVPITSSWSPWPTRSTVAPRAA